ncbi:hypothetical protein M3Y98_00072100 [Aphelenchoides besseyi]|nr:hypothetical protein M3Y98_00072100 [Aphelenchoides besseyi]
MFWIFLIVVVVSLSDVIESDECIRKYENNDDRGFLFANCTDAEIVIKWRKKHDLRFSIIVNDVCKLEIEGKNNSNGLYELMIGDFETNYDRDYWSHFSLRSNVKLDSEWSRAVACSKKKLRNKIDDQWVWTRIRAKAANVALTSDFIVYIYYPDDGEIAQYRRVTE